MSHSKQRKRFAWTLWIPVTLAFLLVITAWTLLINIALDNPVEKVALDTDPPAAASGGAAAAPAPRQTDGEP
jgi:hypothetical protein